MKAEAWSALAAWLTFGIAVVAAVVGLKQYRASSKASAEHARLTRELAEEEARPYVVAYLEASPVGVQWVDLVVRNYGKTAARDVRISVTPEPDQSDNIGTGTHPLKLFEVIGLLAPGQEWRTFWDRSWRRKELDMPEAHEVVLSYCDATGSPMERVALPLDWTPLFEAGHLETYGLHHAADALRGMEKTLGLFSESTGGRGVRVYARDGDDKGRRERERRAAIQRRQEQE